VCTFCSHVSENEHVEENMKQLKCTGEKEADNQRIN
jgi:hypothetical protein